MSFENKVTKKGNELPLMNLKGKPYLQVAHRLVWLVDDADHYTIDTHFHKLEETYAVVQATIKLMDRGGNTLKSASATKRETMKDFPDFIEKAETGAIGRALAMLGFGTQFSTQDLDEGDRLADAPTAISGPPKTDSHKAAPSPKSPVAAPGPVSKGPEAAKPEDPSKMISLVNSKVKVVVQGLKLRTQEQLDERLNSRFGSADISKLNSAQLAEISGLLDSLINNKANKEA
jgi:hypothetical protein